MQQASGSKSQGPSAEDIERNQIITQVKKVKTAEEIAEEELKEQHSQIESQLESYLYKIHGKYINEGDFCGPDATDEQRKAAY